MSKVAKLRNNWRDPDFWTGTAVPYLRSLPRDELYHVYSRLVHGTPSYVTEEDWDNLLLLDACRYDVFSEVNWLDGTLESRISAACVTGNFLKRNFPNTYPDIVFIAGNPHASELVQDRFHAFLPVWQTHWDEDLGTVPPEAMADAVREAAGAYPNKRIVGHFVQPHEPYIGPEALDKFGADYDHGLEAAREGVRSGETVASPETSIIARYRNSEIPREDAVAAYRENLEITLEVVAALHEDISGKTVVSSDHGEMFGEVSWPLPKRRVGHFGGVRATELVKVPWFVLPFEERKEATAGSVQESTTAPDAERSEKLRALGYLQ